MVYTLARNNDNEDDETEIERNLPIGLCCDSARHSPFDTVSVDREQTDLFL